VSEIWKNHSIIWIIGKDKLKVEDMYMKKKTLGYMGLLLLFSILIMASPVPACAGNGCTRIQEGTLLRADGVPIVTGYDEWGYNYQAHLFNGTYCDAYRGAEWCKAWENIRLVMKWNDAWLSNKDCDGDGSLDRHFGFDSYKGSEAWHTNHMWVEYELDGALCQWDSFVKIAAVPVGAVLEGGIWFTEDGTEIGPRIWGEFAVIHQVISDPCGGFEGF
jgi:hypothetical protein